MPYTQYGIVFSIEEGMYAFMIIFFIVLAVTIVMYAAMVKKQNERDEYLKSTRGDDKPRETQPHSPLR